MLGEDYLLHPHHFVHEASAHDQSFHQDGNLPWNDRAHYRTHRPNWAMLFYYPQQVTDDNGPTEVLPGTQYWTTNFENPDGTWHGGDALVKHGRQDALRSDDPAWREGFIEEVVESLGIAGLRRHRILVSARWRGVGALRPDAPRDSCHGSLGSSLHVQVLPAAYPRSERPGVAQ